LSSCSSTILEEPTGEIDIDPPSQIKISDKQVSKTPVAEPGPVSPEVQVTDIKQSTPKTPIEHETPGYIADSSATAEIEQVVTTATDRDLPAPIVDDVSIPYEKPEADRPGIPLPDADNLPGASYWIAPDGDDTSGDGTKAKPWLTYTKAVKYLLPGDTLFARGGTYDAVMGAYDWNKNENSGGIALSGTSIEPIWFRAEPGEVPIFDGKRNQDRNYGEFLIFQNAHDIIVDGLTITGYDNQYGNGAILLVGSSHRIWIQNNRFFDHGGETDDHSIYLGASAVRDVFIFGNRFEDPPGAGVHLWHDPNANNVEIAHNFFKGGHWGIVLGDGASNIDIHHNSFIDGRTHVSLAGHGKMALGRIDVHHNVSSTPYRASVELGIRDRGQYHGWDNVWSDVRPAHPGPPNDAEDYWDLQRLKAQVDEADSTITAANAVDNNGTLSSSLPRRDVGWMVSQAR